ncbi:MAG: hypothetical protein IJW65_02855 [Clostridia bacterium]|nr:hypothetical protein [Clostridia bacterium]
MKPIFGINNDNKNDPQDNSCIFVVAEANEELLAEYEKKLDDELDQQWDNHYEQTNKAKVNRMKILSFVFAIFSAIMLVLHIVSGEISTLLRDNPFMVIVPIGYLLIFGIYMLWTRVIRKKNTDNTDTQCTGSSKEKDVAVSSEDAPSSKDICNQIYVSLGVPEFAQSVDILHFTYKTENGSPVPKKSLKTTEFLNSQMKMFRVEDTLCLADAYCLYELPLDKIGAVNTVKGNFSLLLWNKSTPFDEGEFADYGMKKDFTQRISFDTYCVLELEKDGEIFGLYFPYYELPIIKKILGIASE